jgi:hypothetical protein
VFSGLPDHKAVLRRSARDIRRVCLPSIAEYRPGISQDVK